MISDKDFYADVQGALRALGEPENLSLDECDLADTYALQEFNPKVCAESIAGRRAELKASLAA